MNVITYDIDDPADARIYVKSFAPRLLGKMATYVQTTRRKIYFDAMTDEDACWVARQLWAMEQGRDPSRRPRSPETRRRR